MTANAVTLNPGVGGNKILTDVLSTVDGTAAPGSSEAQVVKVAYGPGGSATNVTSNTPLPVVVPTLVNALSNDAPLATFVTGDPNGDFANINLFEAVVAGDLSFNIRNSDLKLDANGAQLLSDMKGPYYGVATAITNSFIGPIDTTGYGNLVVSIACTVSTTFVAQGSNDSKTWSTLPIAAPNTTMASSVVLSADNNLVMPCITKYVRLIISAAAAGNPVNGVAYLRAGTPIAFSANLIQTVAGGVSDGFANAAAPILVGGKVRTTALAALASGVGATLTMTSGNQLVNKPFSPPETDWQNSLALTTTTSTALSAAGAAGIRNYCTGFQFINTSATPTTINLLDGGSVVWQGNAPASMTSSTVISFLTPLKGTAATAFNVQLGAAVTSVLANAQGYQAP